MMTVLLPAALCFSRIAALFAFVPLPGIRSAIAAPKIVLAALTTLLLAPVWSQQQPLTDASPASLLFWMLTEVLIGLTSGLSVAFLTESFALAAQLSSLQAGFSYASTIDPSSEADATVLTVIAQLTAGSLFFLFGFDREILKGLAASLATIPPGALELGIDRERLVKVVIDLGNATFSTALRIALPVIGLLALVDLALGLVSRIATQFQLLTAVFPVKSALVLFLLAWMSPQLPGLFQHAAQPARIAWNILGGRF